MNANPYRDFVADRKRAVAPAPAPVQQPIPQPVPIAECGSGWYHDEAIRQSQQTPAHKH